MSITFTKFTTRSSPLSRFISPRPASSHFLRAQGFQYKSSSTTTSNEAAMLGKATKAYEANASQQRPLANKPSTPSTFKSNADIRDRFKISTVGEDSTSSSAAPARTGHDAYNHPLHSRSSNGTKSITGMASIYREHSKSFEPESNVIDLTTTTTATPAGANKAHEAVFFAESDFSDDDALELDFKAPSALPEIQQPKPKPAPSTPSQNMPPPPPSSQMPSEATIPWSSSPASHFLPPQPQRVSSSLSGTRSASGKRASPEDDDDCVEVVAPPRAAKKRVLPASFRKEPEEQNESAKTPATKSNGYWDPSASAIKEQKRQRKTNLQTKREASVDNEVPDYPDDYKPKQTAINLSSEQEHVLDLVVNKGRSVFFTGPAGTGKSVLMRAIIAKLKEKYARDPERISVTASTGLAACNISGMTLHSFSGIGLGKEEATELIKKIRRNPKAKGRWLKTKVLVIDEISMVDGDLFDKLSQIGRQIRNNGRPWGGIQLVITGDFFQLPPVPDHGAKRDIKFAFDALTWTTSIDHTIGLTQVFRQRDPEFARMLNEMRLGRISDETVKAFRALSRPLHFDDGVDGAELYPTRVQVDSSNERRLRELPGPVQRYEAADVGKEDMRDKLLQNVMAPKSLDLKVNAQVMLIKNLDDTLVNGSLGKVVGFTDEKTYDIGGGYGMNGEEDSSMAKARAKLKAFSRDASPGAGDSRKYPVVQFNATNGTSRTILCQPEEWKVELPNGEVQAKRSQLPLILAWSLSIHKAQGQTLERVTVNLGKIFEKGQAYVALSRATCQSGLRVIGFDKSKVMAHPKVVTFYNKLYTAEEATARKQPSVMTDFTMNRKGGPTAVTAVPKGSKKIVQPIDVDEEEALAAGYGY